MPGVRQPARRTVVPLNGEEFLINGEPTFKGRSWRGHRVEGLLPNASLVHGIFDDLNPETRGRWVYPDTGTWGPRCNTREFGSRRGAARTPSPVGCWRLFA